MSRTPAPLAVPCAEPEARRAGVRLGIALLDRASRRACGARRTRRSRRGRRRPSCSRRRARRASGQASTPRRTRRTGSARASSASPVARWTRTASIERLLARLDGEVRDLGLVVDLARDATGRPRTSRGASGSGKPPSIGIDVRDVVLVAVRVDHHEDPPERREDVEEVAADELRVLERDLRRQQRLRHAARRVHRVQAQMPREIRDERDSVVGELRLDEEARGEERLDAIRSAYPQCPPPRSPQVPPRRLPLRERTRGCRSSRRRPGRPPMSSSPSTRFMILRAVGLVRDGDGRLRHHRELHRLDREAGVLERLAHGGQRLRRAGDDEARSVELDVVGPCFGRDHDELVLVRVGRRDQDDSAPLELPRDRAGRAEIAAVLRECVAHLRGGAVAVVGDAPPRARRHPPARSPRTRRSRSWPPRRPRRHPSRSRARCCPSASSRSAPSRSRSGARGWPTGPPRPPSRRR